MHTKTAGKIKVSVALDPHAYEQLKRLSSGPHRTGALLDQLILAEAARRAAPTPQPVPDRVRESQLFSRGLVEVQEQERRLLSRDLHDTSGQFITSLMLGLGALKRRADCSEPMQSRIDQLLDVAAAASDDLHRLALNLRPATLDRYGLLPALEQLLAEYGKQGSVELRFTAAEVDTSAERLPEVVETALYRIVQEALTNVSRHAQAHSAEVRLEEKAGTLQVSVADDGQGFDVDEAFRRGRLGLLGMRERAEMLGGTLEIASAPGGGTRITVTVPVRPAESGASAAEAPVAGEAARSGTARLPEPDPRLAEVAELARAKALSDALVGITAGMANHRDAGSLLAYVLGRSAETVGCDYAAIALREGDRWSIANGYRLPDSMLGPRLPDASLPAAVEVERTGETLVLNDVPSRNGLGPGLGAGSAWSGVCIPLYAEARFQGVLACFRDSPGSAFKPSEVDFLERLSALVSLALHNLWLQEEEVRQREESAQREIAAVKAVQAQLEAALASLQETMKALRHAEQQARDLIRYAPTGIYEVDFRTGRFRHVNDAMCQILGYSRDELMQLSAFDLLDDPGKVLFADRIRRTLTGEKVDESVEYRVRRRDGSAIYGVLSTRITYEDGQPSGAFVIAHDVTERRRTAEELREQGENLARLVAEREGILNAIADALVVYDREGRIARMNAVALDMLGYHPEMPPGTIAERAASVTRPHRPDGTPFSPDEFPAVRALRGETLRNEEMVLFVPDRPRSRRVQVSAAPICDPDGTVTGCVATFREIRDALT